MLVGCTVGLLATALTTQAHRSSTHCRVSGSRTRASDGQVRIYAYNGYVIGCVLATGTRTRIGFSGCDPDSCSTDPIRLAGPVAAYGSNFSGRGGSEVRIVVRNLVRRITLLNIPDGHFHPEDAANCSTNGGENYYGIGPVTDLVTRSDGKVAWIARRGCDYRNVKSYEVHTASPRTSDHLVDAGQGIDPVSLTRAGPAVRWLDGGMPRTVRFPR